MIDWPLAVSLWQRGFSTHAIARYIGNLNNEIIHESMIYNSLPFYRWKYK